jgi:wyosine [tRNA(Phe)-imidazoG37] synthetase (radical SAM superfamily)
MITFGPVPSRRLGRSLGINNIPPKICTYSCVYCQLGRTLRMQPNRQAFYEPEEVWHAVRDRIARATEAGEAVDYLTLVPDGEPTLDINLGSTIELLKQSDLPVAVITNASLISRQDVREELLSADWVSLKIDAVEERIWQRIDRPHGTLQLASIMEGARHFAQVYHGDLATETMLLAGINDSEEHLTAIADYLPSLEPSAVYLSIPTRPPAEKWVRAPAEKTLNRAYQILSEQLRRVEYLIGYEGNAFAFTGDVEQDLLSITAVHPMREDAMSSYLARAGAEWTLVERLVAQGELVETEHDGHTFYLRKLGLPN